MTKKYGLFDTGLNLTEQLGSFSVPGIDMASLISAQGKNIDALTKANKLVLEGLQAVFKRQVEIMFQSMEEGAEALKEQIAPGTPQDKAIRSTEMAQGILERTVTDSRELAEIIARSNSEACELLNRRFIQSLEEIKEGLSKTKP